MRYNVGRLRGNGRYGGVPTALAYSPMNKMFLQNDSPEDEYDDNEVAPDVGGYYENSSYDQYDDNEVAPDIDPDDMAPNLSSSFDGEYFRVNNNGKMIGEYRAQSGDSMYQTKAATDVPDLGPIPEGEWQLRYKDLETNTAPYDEDYHDHWGRQRIAITPLNVDTKGRKGFYLHGSYNGLGSAGCIDIGLPMSHFGGIVNKYKQDIPLRVKYKKSFGQRK